MADSKGSIFEAIRQGITSEDEYAIKVLFPSTDRFQLLQMTTELQPRAVMPWSVLGLFRRLYGSKVLRILQEEHNLDKIAQGRLGRVELSEVVSSRRVKRDEEE